MSDTRRPKAGKSMFDKLAENVSASPEPASPLEYWERFNQSATAGPKPNARASDNLDPAPAPDEEAEVRRGEAKVLDTVQSRDYVAFQVLPVRSALMRQQRLFFVPRDGMLQWIGNADLWRIRAPRNGTSIGLVYHSGLVIVEGEGLLGAAIAVNANTCLFLQEYDPEFHNKPEPGRPIITRMKFYDPTSEKADKLQH